MSKAGREKKVLIIAYAFPPHSVVGAMRPLRICKYLRKYTAWSPAVLTVRKKFARSDNELLAEVVATGVRVYRAPIFEPVEALEGIARKVRAFGNRKKRETEGVATSSHGESMARPGRGQGIVRRLKDHVLDAVSTPDYAVFWNAVLPFYAARIIKKERVEVLLVTSPPWSAQMTGWIVKKVFRIPWIADFRDPWTDIKRGPKSIWASRLEGWLERHLLSGATSVISSSDTYTEDLRRKYPFMGEGKFVTLLNGYDDEKFATVREKATDKFTIVHLGSLYSMMNPHFFLTAFKTWLSHHEMERQRIELVFVGEIDEVTRNMVASLAISDVVRVTGFLPHDRAIAECISSDLLILLLGTTSVSPAGWIPSKLFEYIGCGRPILALVRQGEAENLIKRTRSGAVINGEDEDAVHSVLEGLFQKKVQSGNGRVEWKNDACEARCIKQKFLMEKLGSILDSACGSTE